MSKYLHEKYNNMVTYVPGEQPKDRKYIKLNANETSMPPSPKVLEAITNEKINGMGLYSDPHCKKIREAIAKVYNVTVEQVFVGNGSDEVLGFCFMSYFAEDSKICFPDITYGFYKVYAKTHGIDAKEFPLKEDFTIDVEQYVNTDRHVVLANPNAPTGYRLELDQIEEILKANKQRIVLIDEAYVDYDNESCIKLLDKYPNLIVVQTFSKSRNLAGARIGFAIASKEIIEDLNAMKFTFNPYNLSELTIAAGTASVLDTEYLEKSVKIIIDNREFTKSSLEKLGFYVMKSHTNFIFVKHPKVHASILYKKFKKEGILTRYYTQERIKDYLRITIGTREEMEAVLKVTNKILK